MAGHQDTSFTASAKLHAIERELKYRYRVYPRLVARGDMSEQQKNRQIEIMEEIAADYRAQAEAEARKGSLL